MRVYRTREAAELVGMTPPQVRAFARTGILRPQRGPRRIFLFAFQDLVILRTAKKLSRSVSARRVNRVFGKLTHQLSPNRSLTEVELTTQEDTIVAHDGRHRWSPESGQLLLDFGTAGSGAVSQLLPTRSGQLTADEYLSLGVELSHCAPGEAEEAFREALKQDPQSADAHSNLGRLRQRDGDLVGAEEHYRMALKADPDHGVAHFNLATLQQLRGERDAAIEGYLRAVSLEPGLSDAHYHLATLYQAQGRELDALRHLKQYRSTRPAD